MSEELLEKVLKPGQYLGNEWGARRKPFDAAQVRLALAFPDLYELGMSNFGLKILYSIVNNDEKLLCDRTYAPNSDMEALLRERNLPLWGWEARRPLADYELVGFSLQYELCYTNVLNMLELAQLPVRAADRTELFPLVFGGGPSSVNPEPMAPFMDFFIIGDGERAVPHAMHVIAEFKEQNPEASADPTARQRVLARLATEVPGVYVPQFYQVGEDSPVPKPIDIRHLVIDETKVLPERVFRQTVGLDDSNAPTDSIVPYLTLVHDREVLEVRRGCDRGCRFCQPGYTFLPVRERSTDDLLRLSKESMANSGHQEYSMLSLCVSDYTSLQESVRALNREHSARRSSLSFPSQRADRMTLELAEVLKSVRKSGITLAPEAGTERMRRVINKGLSHQQIISAIEAAYQSGWASVKLYFMCCLPTERDEDLVGIVDILKEATLHCRVIRKTDPAKYKKDIELTCTISNFVPKPFTPFQWFGPVDREETRRKHQVLRQAVRDARMRNITLNVTDPEISLLESAIGRGGREAGDLIFEAWKLGCTFDAWDDRLKFDKWQEAAANRGTTLEAMGCDSREVGSDQAWDIVHIGLNNWWMVKEWNKAMTELETAPCTENLCHACGVCTELETTHLLAQPKPEAIKRNPFVKELAANTQDGDSHPSLFFQKPEEAPIEDFHTRVRFKMKKTGDLRFIGHLDLAMLLTRAARRAFLNVVYSKGFNPQPKLILAGPLPLFHQSEGEVGDIDLAQEVDAEEFRTRLNKQLPSEVQIVDARVITALSNNATISLSSILAAARYRATLVGLDGDSDKIDPEKLSSMVQEKIDAALASASLLFTAPEREGKEKSSPKDIRPGILELKMVEKSPVVLEIRLAHGPQMHVKPNDLLTLLQPPELVQPMTWRITRLELEAAGGVSLFDT